jgi:hypothetical protein
MLMLVERSMFVEFIPFGFLPWTLLDMGIFAESM